MANQAPSNIPAKKSDVMTILGDCKAELARALPRHLTADRMTRIFMTEVRKNPKLGLCDPYSFIGAVMKCSQLGLEPGDGLGHAYLIPYGKEVTFIPGYKGLAELARRSGKIKGIHCENVCKGDLFKHGVKNGIPYLDWEPLADDRDEKNITHTFATAIYDDGSPQWVVMSRGQVDKIRDGLRYVSDVWKQHYGEMAKKTAVRRLCKLLPQSPELVEAQEADDTVNAGASQSNHLALVASGIIDASYSVEPPHDPAKTMAESDAAGRERGAPMPDEKLTQEKTRYEATQEFRQTYERAKASGLTLGDAAKLMGMEADRVVSQPTAEIEAGTDILNAWIAKKGAKK